MKPKNMKQKKVLVAMSGGVDSSVAALLMKRLGFNVIGAFMKNYSDSKNELTGECSWKEERGYAMKISALLGIPLITLDFEKEYKNFVVKKMFRDYKKGITPNPDISCNEKVKFPLLIKAAKKLGADFVVTGHYSRIKKVKIRERKSANAGKKEFSYNLLRAKDESKDQSYFLYRLKQDELKKLIFPIGDYTKKQVREIALKEGFPNHDKKSTVGICFIGKINLKRFLQKKIKPRKGKILNPSGEVVGEHDGIYYYTIGQRLGLRYGFDLKKSGGDKKFLRKWYVAQKDAIKNIIIAAPEGHKILYRKEIFLKNTHWVNEKPKNNMKVLARIRQVGELLPSKIMINRNKIKIVLNIAITGISEGQAVVLYSGKKVLGGGEIMFS